jgi:hypothetical protein
MALATGIALFLAPVAVAVLLAIVAFRSAEQTSGWTLAISLSLVCAAWAATLGLKLEHCAAGACPSGHETTQLAIAVPAVVLLLVAWWASVAGRRLAVIVLVPLSQLLTAVAVSTIDVAATVFLVVLAVAELGVVLVRNLLTDRARVRGAARNGDAPSAY